MIISARDKESEMDDREGLSDEEFGRSRLVMGIHNLKDANEFLSAIEEAIKNKENFSNDSLHKAYASTMVIFQAVALDSRSILEDLKSVNFPKNEEVKNYVSSLVELGERIKSISEKIGELHGIPETEGRDLAPVEIKEISSEEIQDKILEKVEEKKKAISKKEQDKIQAEIVSLLGQL